VNYDFNKDIEPYFHGNLTKKTYIDKINDSVVCTDCTNFLTWEKGTGGKVVATGQKTPLLEMKPNS
jgi:hypothetical protein